jgi:hypothetical protein
MNTFKPSWMQLAALCAVGVFFLAGPMIYAEIRYGDSMFVTQLTYLESFAIFFAASLLGLGAHLIRVRDLRSGQRTRDGYAVHIKCAVLQGGALPTYSLYLRTFELTAGLGVPFEEHRLLRGVDGQKDRDLETLLAEALEPMAPLIALGRTGEHIGAGRIEVVEQGWQYLVELLMRGAGCIIVIPSHRHGTLWEVATLLRRQLMRSALFLMPSSTEKTKYAVAGSWRNAVEDLRELAVILPSYTSSGAVFRMAQNGVWHSFRELPKRLTPVALRATIEDVMALSFSAPNPPAAADAARR